MGKKEEKYRGLLKADKITTIVTDLDGTLWKGIIAEKQKPVLNKDYFELLKNLYKKGIQIFVVSKNDKEDVIKSFSELGITKELFVEIISNWDAKYLNIEKLLSQTGIRQETVIFIDDNLLELTEVATSMKSIFCVNALDWQIIKQNNYLNNKEIQPEEEIKERINRYRTAIWANQIKKNFQKEDKEFLHSLKRELSIGEISFENIDRFTRLLVVTHRINFNPEKFKDYDNALDYLYKKVNEGYKLYAVSTRENNIPLGLTGAIVVRFNKNKAIVEDATFSCGIIGRDFEQRSLLALLELLEKAGVKEVEFIVKLTSTNKRVREIFEELNFNIKKENGREVFYNVTLKGYKPSKNYEWIKISSTPPEMDYTGIPSIMEFLDKLVKPLIKKNYAIINLGAAKGEVLGHLKKDTRKLFYDFIQKNNIKYTKVDIEKLPEEKIVVANAEDMTRVIENNSQDIVMAIELLEHTEHFWKVVNETIRICKVGGYIFITVPSYQYPKHEYPIDLWRIGEKTLSSFFPKSSFEIIHIEKEGNSQFPRRTMILVKKISEFKASYSLPEGGKTDWQTGLTIFD